MSNFRQESAASYDLAVVGGGFCGLAIIYFLAKEACAARRRIRVALWERDSKLGLGVAYGTSANEHLLNVRATGMSISDSEPNSFADWLAKHAPAYGPTSFAPRKLYGQYLQQLIAATLAESADYLALQVVHAEAADMQRSSSGYMISSADGINTRSGAVVLALGTLPIRSKRNSMLDGLSSPWDSASLERAARSSTVGLVGAGLTAIDTVLALEGRGFKGNYTLLSRHGHLPHPQLPTQGASTAALAKDICEKRTIRDALRAYRQAVLSGTPWLDLMESLRPYTQEGWARFSVAEQRRFLRHVKSFWEIHRHRVPEESLSKVMAVKAAGRLTHECASLTAVKRSQGGILLERRARRTQQKTVSAFDVAFNCMGLCADLSKADSAILGAVVAQGLGAYDPLRLGLRTVHSGNLTAADGTVQRDIFTLGVLRRGDLWESTAVRELRAQAQRIAVAVTRRMAAEGAGTVSVRQTGAAISA